MPNRFTGGFSPDEMRELREASDRIMRAIDGIKSDFRADLLELKAEIKATNVTMVPRTEYEVGRRALEERVESLEERRDATPSYVISLISLVVATLIPLVLFFLAHYRP